MDKSSDQTRMDQSRTEQQGDFTSRLTKADWIVGHRVVNANNEEIATVRDLVLDQRLDRVSYAALGTGGVLSVGEKLHAVPWNALTINPDNKTITMATDKKTLADSPSFDQSNWPESGDSRWDTRQGGTQDGANVHTHVKVGNTEVRIEDSDMDADRSMDRSGETARGDKNADESTGAQMTSGGRYFEYRRATELIGLNVKNKQNETLGEIENLLIDMREGRVVYSYISFGGVMGIGDKLAAVPWSSINVRPRLDAARLDADRKMLDALAMEQGKDLDLNNRETAQKLYTRFNEEPYWEVFGYVGAEDRGERMIKPDAWMSGSKYSAQFDPKTIVDIDCTVESVGTFKPAADAAPGIRLKVITNDKKTMTVHAGPRSFAAQKGMGFSYGDQLKVTGSRCEVDGRTVIMATKVQNAGKTLELRDQSGQPKWDAKDLK